MRSFSYAVQTTSHGAVNPERADPDRYPHAPWAPGLGAGAVDARTRAPEVRCMRQSVTAAPAASKSARPRPTATRWWRWLYPSGSGPSRVAPTSG